LCSPEERLVKMALQLRVDGARVQRVGRDSSSFNVERQSL
jgi:hypothetical protein